MTARRQWAIVAGIVAVIAIALFAGTRLLGGEFSAVEAGSKAPHFSAVPVATSAHAAPGLAPRTIADYRGQVVLLNVWATWCDPCRAEMPSIERLYEALGPEGLKVVAVSVDNAGMEPAIRAFAQELGLKFEILYDAQGQIQTDYQTSGIPETFIIGKDGVIRKRVIAAADWGSDSQKALIRQLLAEPGA